MEETRLLKTAPFNQLNQEQQREIVPHMEGEGKPSSKKRDRSPSDKRSSPSQKITRVATEDMTFTLFADPHDEHSQSDSSSEDMALSEAQKSEQSSCWSSSAVAEFQEFLRTNVNGSRPNQQRLKLLEEYARNPKRKATSQVEYKAKHDAKVHWQIVEGALCRRVGKNLKELLCHRNAWQAYTTKHIAKNHCKAAELKNSLAKRYFGAHQNEAQWIVDNCRSCTQPNPRLLPRWAVWVVSFTEEKFVDERFANSHALFIEAEPAGKIAVLAIHSLCANEIAESLSLAMRFWTAPKAIQSNGQAEVASAITLVQSWLGLEMVVDPGTSPSLTAKVESSERALADKFTEAKDAERPLHWNTMLTELTWESPLEKLEEGQRSEPQNRILSEPTSPAASDSIIQIREFCKIGRAVLKDLKNDDDISELMLSAEDSERPFAHLLLYIFSDSGKASSARGTLNFFDETLESVAPRSDNEDRISGIWRDIIGAGASVASFERLEQAFQWASLLYHPDDDDPHTSALRRAARIGFPAISTHAMVSFISASIQGSQPVSLDLTSEEFAALVFQKFPVGDVVMRYRGIEREYNDQNYQLMVETARRLSPDDPLLDVVLAADMTNPRVRADFNAWVRSKSESLTGVLQ